MLESIKDILPKIEYDLLLIIISILIGYLLDRLFKFLRLKYFIFKLRSDLTKIKANEHRLSTTDIENGDPEFKKSNIFARELSILGRPTKLFISVDPDIGRLLTEKQKSLGYSESQITKFHNDTSFDGSSDFMELQDLTGISDLTVLIAKHRKIVSQSFLESKSGMLFNGPKYGVFDIRTRRFGEREEPGVELDFFQTDYFTHRVFRSIYDELKERHHEIESCSPHIALQKYKPFFTSFGINCLLISRGTMGKEIVLAKRSAKVAGNEPLYHVTMNEGLSQTDKDAFGKVDLELCFQRGLKEELGIDTRILEKEHYPKEFLHASFYDFFLDRKNFEIGLSCCLHLELNFHTGILDLIARDKHLETEGFITVPLKTKDITNFVKANDFVPHGLYVLKRVLLRERINIKV